MRLRLKNLPYLALLPVFFALACGPEAPPGTGGSGLEEVTGTDGRSCGRGVAVLMTDYLSTNVALLDLQGETASGSFISSASTETILNAPLSGDVVFPSSRMSGELVLIDRFPASVLSFVDIESAEVRTQLSVRTGFDANPQDYLELSSSRAWVSRYELNPTPGEESFDEGDDLLEVDPEEARIRSRISLSETGTGEESRARPGALLQLGDWVLTGLAGYDAAFEGAEDGRLVLLAADSKEVVRTQVLAGLQNCAGLALSPDQSRLAVTCTGLIDRAGADSNSPAGSGILIFEIEGALSGGEAPTLRETDRILASDLQSGPLTSSVSFYSDEGLLFSTYGALDGPDEGRPDRVHQLKLDSLQTQELIASEDGAFVLEDVLCVEACGVCFAADAGRGVVHRIEIDDSSDATVTPLTVESDVDLPPRSLGWF